MYYRKPQLIGVLWMMCRLRLSSSGWLGWYHCSEEKQRILTKPK